MDPAKNRAIGGRSKFFMCFNPVLAVDDRVPVSDSETSVRRKKRFRRSLAGVMKAVLVRTSLVKKIRSKKSRQDSSSRSSNHSHSSASTQKNGKNDKNKNQSLEEGLWNEEQRLSRTDSDASVLFSPTSGDSPGSSSISSNSRSGSDRIKTSSSFDHLKHLVANPIVISRRKPSKRKARKLNQTAGVCMFLLCLLALVFWGKIVAIATCTTTWLFLSPRRKHHRRPRCSVGSCTNSSGFGSGEYKKRVIMEGLLERNHLG